MIEMKDYEAMAMLDLPEEERGRLGEAFGAVVAGFAELDGIDAGDAEPLVTVLDRRNVLREDVACRIVSRDELLANAPERYEGYFQVPGTLE